MKSFSWIIILGAGLWACSSVNTITVHSDSIRLTDQYESDSTIDLYIKPYKDSLKEEMGVVIAQSETSFSSETGMASIGNWVANAVYSNQTRSINSKEPVMCLLNSGGIRSTLNKGPITVGDMFKLMPFDNEVVWVKMPVQSIQSIENYLTKTGCQPLSNATMKNGKLHINGLKDSDASFWILTSDYLMNGGDKMDFFQQKIEIKSPGKLLRNVLIEEAKQQQILIDDKNIHCSF
jgi:2',3'-cyclic-nucleotide 2'-phosphodiesterase (5'-nucleotidase family)